MPKSSRYQRSQNVTSWQIILPGNIFSNIVNKPTPNIYFEKLFGNTILDWDKIYLSPRLATIDTTLRSFQYKILNNVIFLNKKLYTFGITNTDICSYTHFIWLLSCLMSLGKITNEISERFYFAVTYTTGCHSWTV